MPSLLFCFSIRCLISWYFSYLWGFGSFTHVSTLGHNIFNRPGVNGAVLQTPLLLIYWLIDWLTQSFFVKISLKHFHYQTLKSRHRPFAMQLQQKAKSSKMVVNFEPMMQFFTLKLWNTFGLFGSFRLVSPIFYLNIWFVFTNC